MHKYLSENELMIAKIKALKIIIIPQNCVRLTYLYPLIYESSLIMCGEKKGVFEENSTLLLFLQNYMIYRDETTCIL